MFSGCVPYSRWSFRRFMRSTVAINDCSFLSTSITLRGVEKTVATDIIDQSNGKSASENNDENICHTSTCNRNSNCDILYFRYLH